MWEKARPFVIAVLGLLVAGAVIVLAWPRPRPAIELLPLPSPLPSATPAPLTVQISGAVQQPGLYTLPPGSIVDDALTTAGLSADADLSAINRAAPLLNGAWIIVPAVGEAPPPADTTEGMVIPDGTLININTATAAQLETLPGIGPGKAEAIIAHRNEHGPFATIEDIMLVSGIGETTFASIQPHITAGP